METLSNNQPAPNTGTRRAARRADLLDTAWHVIAAKGERVSMDDIAVEAGISRPILYRHFGDVGGLYLAVAERFTDLLFEAFSQLSEAGQGRPLLEATVDAYIGTIDAQPGVYRYLTRRPGPERPTGDDPVAGFVRLLGDRVTEFLTSLGLPPEVAAVRAHSLVGGIQAAGDWWLDTHQITRSELVHRLGDALWAGHGTAPS